MGDAALLLLAVVAVWLWVLNRGLRRELASGAAGVRFARTVAAAGSAEDVRRALVDAADGLVGASGAEVRRCEGGGTAGGGTAVALVHAGRNLGTLWVPRRCGARELAALEGLAATAAAALVGKEAVRLEGALLAVRTAQHGIRNAITAAFACAEIVADDPSVPLELRRLSEEALAGTRLATEHLDRLGQLSRIEEQHWGPHGGTTIDLERSAVAR